MSQSSSGSQIEEEEENMLIARKSSLTRLLLLVQFFFVFFITFSIGVAFLHSTSFFNWNKGMDTVQNDNTVMSILQNGLGLSSSERQAIGGKSVMGNRTKDDTWYF